MSTRIIHLLTLLLFVACSGGQYTTALDDPELDGLGGEGSLGGDTSIEAAGGASVEGTGGKPPEQTGGALEQTGGTFEQTGGSPSTGGQEGTGGSSGPVPPYTPTECYNFTCGTTTLNFTAGVVHCFNVQAPASSAGNLGDYDTGTKPGNCIATLDGEPEDFSDGLTPGRLLVWGCNGWANCY